MARDKSKSIENNVNRGKKNMHTDNSYVDQPQDTIRFALNAVNETDKGDNDFKSNEESNEICYTLPTDYTFLGSVYLGNGKTAIFSVSKDESTSEIGIADDDCNYITHVNDATSPIANKLNFKIINQTDATYRLRRGCENTIYFADGIRFSSNRPRYYNFDKPEQFKDINGEWDSNKFELVRSYRSVPTFDDIQVLNSGGRIEPGSVNVSIQYVDEDLNPTEWITTTNIISIYNDDTTNEYVKIRGSINSDADYINFPTTNKSIRVEVGNLDQSFLFYRLAFIEANAGTGLVTNINFTDVIPTTKNYFIYTGINFFSQGTELEVAAFQQIIDKASSINQIDNLLVLGNVQGKPVDFCKLQSFASRIKADMITSTVLLNTISTGNPKNPTVMLETAGYMPGEIMSFGVVWVFDDGSVTPTYHIPGKSPSADALTIFDPSIGDNVYPMSNNNQSTNNIYTDNNSCTNADYWGVDSEGLPLKNSPVRHHRFPTRSSLGLPLFTVIDSTSSEVTYYQVRVEGTGTIDTPCTAQQEVDGDCTPTKTAEPFQANVYYTVKGVAKNLIVNINPIVYFNDTTTYDLTIEQQSAILIADSISDIVITKIEESKDDGTIEDVTAGGVSTHGLVWTATAVEASFTSEENIYSSKSFGIQFSGIELPNTDFTNGEVIVGYYIVRNERTEDEKTILDSAVLTPTLINEKYIAHGLLGTELADNTRLSKRVFGMIHPEHKFHNNKYTEVARIEQEGVFNIIDRKKSKSRYLDVLEGTSHDPDVHKDTTGGKDDDGWSLKCISRDNIVNYTTSTFFNKEDTDIEDIFYLDALESREIKQDNEEVSNVYNIAGDNKVGIIHLKADYTNNLLNKLPYVYIKRDIADSYSAFRILPYYKASNNIESGDKSVVFGGDTFISPMRYVNTMFWDNRIAERAGKTSTWNYIIGALAIVVGVVLTVLSFGALAAVSTIVVGAGIAIIGGGALFIASGVKKDALVKAYHDEYEKGLRETALDDWTEKEYVDFEGVYKGNTRNADTPRDDEIQWLGDCVTDLWFESQVNIQLRHGFLAEATPTFLDAPGHIETGNYTAEIISEFFGIYRIEDTTILPITRLDTHLMAKLVAFDAEREDGRSYIGHALGELYEINPDYLRINRQKTYSHLGIEYDCCSACQEEFPQRFHWSEQSFQEELSDNYRVFLPNNYKDIEGEKGVITNMYRMQNNLYIHTEEALWHLPQTYQERITGDVISFLGTGSYFELPPRLVVDDDKSSAGTQHKWSAIKTSQGILFVSQRESKVYLFDGNKLKAISDYGMSSWFKSNMQSKNALEFYRANGTQYPYIDNPSNSIGTGFISTYDTDKERFIVTKKDFGLNTTNLPASDYQICINDGNTIILENYQATINTYVGNGYVYEGVEDCRMKFSNIEFVDVEEEREIVTTIPNDSDVIVQLDMSGSFDDIARDTIRQAAKDWKIQYANTNSSWTGNLYFCEIVGTESEQWIKTLEWILAGTNIYDESGNPVNAITISSNIIALSFVNEHLTSYHPTGIAATIPVYGTSYAGAYNSFVSAYDAHILSGGTFLALLYPIVMTQAASPTYWEDTNGFLQHAFGALKGNDYTLLERLRYSQPTNIYVSDWTLLRTSLSNPNPYFDLGPGVDEYGWDLIFYRGWDGTGDVITSAQFQQDLDLFIAGNTTTEIVTVIVQQPVLVFTYVDGVPLVGDLINLNNSWTMSYDIADESWISYHSFLPNAYFYVANKFYSWKFGNNNIWKHGMQGSYQTYYGVFYPHIIEVVSLPAALATLIWEYLSFQTEAREWDTTTESYVDKNITHNKIMLYNTRQLSGMLNMVVKNTMEDADYLMSQITNNNNGDIIVSRNERDWNINDFRDIRIDYDVPMFIEKLDLLQSEYYIDKIINEVSIDFEKDWTQLESFRDKFLVVRFIFDNFDNIRLITNYSVESEKQSPR